MNNFNLKINNKGEISLIKSYLNYAGPTLNFLIIEVLL